MWEEGGNGMTDLRETAPDFAREWHRWHEERWSEVAAPHGIAALADTVWLGRHERPVAGVAGMWRAEADAVVGTGLSGSGYSDASGSPLPDTIVLRPGDTAHAGDVLLRTFVREGIPALRRVDPHAPRRTSLRSIAAYEPDPDWVAEARFTPRDEPLAVEQVDGHHTVQSGAGTLEFRLHGRAHRLTATTGVGELSVVFSDSSSGDETYRFRFVRPRLPDGAGRTVVDFNRSFLPPCAFSDHYVCPMPSPENRLDIAVTVGERMPRYEGGAA